MTELDCDHDGFGVDACPSACSVPSGRDDPTSISNLMAAGPRMAWADQEFLQDDELGTVGDCWRACIANLVGAPLHTVPHFVRDNLDWVAATQSWLRGWLSQTLIRVDAQYPITSPLSNHVVLIGNSPRGTGHAVLALASTGELVHDPHPSRDGLVNVSCAYVLSSIYYTVQTW